MTLFLQYFPHFKVQFIQISIGLLLFGAFRSIGELPPLLPEWSGQTNYQVKTSQHFLKVTPKDKCGNGSKIE